MSPAARKPRARRATPRLGAPRGHVPREDRLDDVIDVATRLFCERGFRGTRLDDISDELGVTRAALYYYFDSKHDVLEEVCARAMTSTEEALRRVRELDDPGERLRGFAHTYVQNMSSDAARVFARDNKELRAAFRRGLMARARAVNEGAEGIVRYGVEKGEFSPDLDVRLTTLGFLGMINAMADWHRPNRDGSITDVADLLVDVYIQGIAVRPAAKPRRAVASRAK